MAVVDAERVLAELKAYFTTQSSFGQRQLLAEVARLEGQSVIDEDAYQRFLRRFAVELDESFRNTTPGVADPLSDAPLGQPVMDPNGSAIEKATASEGDTACPPQTHRPAPARSATRPSHPRVPRAAAPPSFATLAT